jgi:hypothetical protein
MPPQYVSYLTVSGITGSTPICASIEIVYADYGSAKFEVSDNNPNDTYFVEGYYFVWGGGSDSVTINLYDSENNLIATGTGVV